MKTAQGTLVLAALLLISALVIALFVLSSGPTDLVTGAFAGT